jgi:hypothetical protein
LEREAIVEEESIQVMKKLAVVRLLYCDLGLEWANGIE